jgi:hypothetical protein
LPPGPILLDIEVLMVPKAKNGQVLMTQNRLKTAEKPVECRREIH